MKALIRVRMLLDQAQGGEFPTPHELSEVARRAREEAPLLEDDEGLELTKYFNKLLQLVEEAQQAKRDELNQVTSGRRALAGYGSLRSNTRSQRIYKRV